MKIKLRINKKIQTKKNNDHNNDIKLNILKIN